MTSPTPGVLVGEPNATWPDFGTTVVNQEPSTPFALTVPESQPCGTPVSASFTGDASSGAFSVPTASITIGGPAFTNSTDVPKAIPDNSSAGVNSTFTFPSSGTVSDLDVRIGQLNHTWVGDLKITLSHDATTVTLMNRPGSGTNGSSGNDFHDLVLDDEAATPIDSIPSANPPGGFTGSYKPDQPLSAFDGQSTSGTWTLNVSDNAAADTGSLLAWGASPGATCDVFALPTVDTAPATGIATDGATLNANLDPKGKATDYRFQYGTTDAYGNRTDAGSGGSSSGASPVSTPVSGLSPSTTYHFRALALRDGVVVAQGPDQTFTTSTPVSAPPLADAVAKITKGPKSKSKKSKATFEFTSNEAGAHFTCKLDSEPAAACTSPTKYKHLKKGEHTFSVTATGASGKAGPAATQTWKVKKKRKHHHHHHHH
jgi:subtilisin-like proprotein convertase family protein